MFRLNMFELLHADAAALKSFIEQAAGTLRINGWTSGMLPRKILFYVN